ncbi:MAG: hypothetical protein EBR02_07060 [Alphaproteobacteria bacterium]|nr:hypothetical protein [Alphaproteobacteria bacterium]
MTVIAQTLNSIFPKDFSTCKNAGDFRTRFFEHELSISDLQKAFDVVAESSVTLGGKKIEGAILIEGKERCDAPLAILAQLHGNEPAGQGGILLAMALSQAGLLERDVIGVAGNILAAKQYYEAYAANPRARQETRDAFRCGLAEDGSLLPDLNRIPVDFLTNGKTDAHTLRARALWEIGQHVSAFIDIHSARGNMVCITDHKRDADLKLSPIRSVLVGLADAISANASASVTVKTLKTILFPQKNILCHLGIEAGRHEMPDAPGIAAAFTLSVLYTQGLTKVLPILDHEDGIFEAYNVRPRITYADLKRKGDVQPDDKIYMVQKCTKMDAIPARSDRVVMKKKDGTYVVQTILEAILTPKGEMQYAIFQYDEMEEIKKGAVVGLAVPSGATFSTTETFSGIFFSKSGTLYDKDPAVGPWPVPASSLATTKFCYPCDVSEIKIKF